MHNGITEIPPGVFTNMSSLISLWLRTNYIRVIYSGGFTGLSSVTYISLQGNPIQSIASGVFESTPSLETLVLDGGAAPPTLQRGIFSGLTNLRVLRITTGDAGRITTIETGAFSDLIRVGSLPLMNQNLVTLGDRFFTNVTFESVLRLRNNRLTSIGNQTFGGLTFVLTLDLRHNHLSLIADDAFADMVSLSTLRLDNNRFEELTSGALRGLASLGLLNLTFNSISIIGNEAFDGLTNLASLSIDNNRLASYASLQSPDLIKLADCSSTLSWFPQQNGNRYGVERCIVTKGACSESGDVCRSQASCVSMYGLRSGCCSSSLGACRACTTNASVPLLPVCVQCEGCSVVDGHTIDGGNSTQGAPTSSPTSAPTPMYSEVFPAGCCRTEAGGSGTTLAIRSVSSVAECASACTAQTSPMCFGYETTPDGTNFNCELHTSAQDFDHTTGSGTCRCFVLTPNSRPRFYVQHNPATCQLLFGGMCLTDGPGYFHPSRRCEVMVTMPGTLTVDLVTESIGYEPFSIISETDYAYKDGLRVDSTCDYTDSCLTDGCDCLDSRSSINGLTVRNGSNIQWNTATVTTRPQDIAAGFVLCVLPYWTKENDDSMCPLPSMARTYPCSG